MADHHSRPGQPTRLSEFTARLTAALAGARSENAAVAPELAHDNLRRLQGLAAVMLCISLLHVWAFSGPQLAEAAHVAQWRQTLVTLHLAMAGVAASMGLLALRLHRLGPTARPGWTQACSVGAFLLALVFAALIVAVDQWVTPNITPFFMASVLVGVTLLQRPLIAAALFALAYAVFFWALGQTQDDASMLLSNRANGLTAVVLAWALATLTWRKSARNLLLTRQLAQRQAQMHGQQQELVRMATCDGLTGLINRAEFERLGLLEVERARRYGLAVSLLLLDLDHFKLVNDQWGHPAGDAVLKEVATVLRTHVRASDVVARMGGEEFMVLLPHTHLDAALALAEKLRQCVAATHVHVGGHTLRVTASVGLAAASGNEVNFTSLYQRADHALYSAKAAGRNVVRAE